MSLFIGIFVVLLFFVFFLGFEMVFVLVNKFKIEFKKKKGFYCSLILFDWYDGFNNFISIMLVGNNIVFVIFVMLMGELLGFVIVEWFGIFNESMWQLLFQIILIIIVVLFFGEFLLKMLFWLFVDDLFYFLVIFLRGIQVLFFFFFWLMIKVFDLILCLFFKKEYVVIEQVFIRLDLENFVKEFCFDVQEVIDKELFGKVLNLCEVWVCESMVFCIEIESIDINVSVEEFVDFFYKICFFCLLVIDEEVDNVVGYVYYQ